MAIYSLQQHKILEISNKKNKKIKRCMHQSNKNLIQNKTCHKTKNAAQPNNFPLHILRILEMLLPESLMVPKFVPQKQYEFLGFWDPISKLQAHEPGLGFPCSPNPELASQASQVEVYLQYCSYTKINFEHKNQSYVQFLGNIVI